MKQRTDNFTTFWDVASSREATSADQTFSWAVVCPQKAASALIELYGPEAVRAALECARLADVGGCDEDFHFWEEVMAIVLKGQTRH